METSPPPPSPPSIVLFHPEFCDEGQVQVLINFLNWRKILDRLRQVYIWLGIRDFLFSYIFCGRARVCWPLLCLCCPFMIFDGCLNSNSECCRSKRARYLSHLSPYLSTNPSAQPPIPLPQPPIPLLSHPSPVISQPSPYLSTHPLTYPSTPPVCETFAILLFQLLYQNIFFMDSEY